MKHRKCLGVDLAEQGKNLSFTSIGDGDFHALGKAESVLRIHKWTKWLDYRPWFQAHEVSQIKYKAIQDPHFRTDNG